MSGPATVAAIAVTLAAVCRLAATDPKRRRAFGLPAFAGRRHARLLVALVLVPGALLLLGGAGAGFVIWLGTVTVAGWVVAAVSPVRVATMVGRLRQALDRIRPLVPRRSAPTAVDSEAAARIAELERRVAALEAALAGIRSSDAGLQQESRVARIA